MHRPLTVTAAIVTVLATSPALPAQGQAVTPDPGQSPAMARQARWPASENLQTTMNDVANLFRSARAEMPENQPTAAQLDALADGLANHVARISVDDTGPDPAKKALTLIIGEFRDGIDLMRHASHLAARRLGYLMAVRTANNYGKEFDHAGWEPLSEN